MLNIVSTLIILDKKIYPQGNEKQNSDMNCHSIMFRLFMHSIVEKELQSSILDKPGGST